MQRIGLLMLCLALALTACAPAGKGGGEALGAEAASGNAATAEGSVPGAEAAPVNAASAEGSALASAAASTGGESEGARSDGVRIPLSAIKDGVLFVDCASGETAMQILARVNASGEPGLAWNTCETCAGSPAAYFELDGEELVCQNCGNRFSLDSVGAASMGGCMPWPLSGYVLEDGEIVVPQAVIDEMAVAFRNWRKGL